jgi:hypothetical protein
MVFALDAPIAIWNTLAAAFFGSLLATAIVAFLTQRWIEKRERRDRRDDLRLQLYLNVVDLVMDNEWGLAERGFEGQVPPRDIQTKRIHIRHRLKLLGSPPVLDAYEKYRELVSQSTENPTGQRPETSDVVDAREQLFDTMAREFQDGRARQPNGC